MHQRDEHLSLPAALLPQVAPDCGEAYLVALLDELAMDPGAGDALLGSGPAPPL
jgi:hypothetical protein